MARILAVDDSVTMRRVIELTFAGEGHAVTAVGTVAEAALQLGLDERAGAQALPDVVICDVSMNPNVYELARMMRSGGATAAIPLLALASAKHPYNAEQGRQAGVTDHLLKPYDSQVMIDRVAELLQKRISGPPARAISHTAGFTAGRAVNPAPAPGMGLPRVAAGNPLARTAMGLGQQQSANPGSAPQPLPAAPMVANPTPMGAVAPTTPGSGPHRPPSRPNLPIPSTAVVSNDAKIGDSVVARLDQLPRSDARVGAAADDFARRASQPGLSRDELTELARQTIERVVWEVVPDLAEAMIRDELQRILRTRS